MPNTQVPPEGTFSAYYREISTHEWYEALSDEIHNALNSIVIEPRGWGTCECGAVSALYSRCLDNGEQERVLKRVCPRCIRNRVISESILLSDCVFTQTRETPKTLMPTEHFPPQVETRVTCPECNSLILLTTDHNAYDTHYTLSCTVTIRNVETLVHTSCTYLCSGCSERHVIRISMRYTYEGNFMCHACFREVENDAYQCEDCSDYFSELSHCDIRGRSICDDCYGQGFDCDDCGYTMYADEEHVCNRENGSLIYDYSYKPNPRFYGSAEYYFGIELEVEDVNEWGCNAGAEVVIDAVGERMYMKQDGSLNDGFEIVSHPHSLEALREINWKFLAELRRLGFRSWDVSTCGLHVHVSRTAFRKNGKRDEAHELRFQKLIYDNDKQVSAIAGRESSYARFNDKGHLVPKVKYGQSADRYEAINILNDHTLEIRVFRGSLKKERVLSAVEFVHSAIEYTRNMKIDPKGKQLSWVRFIGYVMDNQEKYQNFTQIALSALDNVRVPLTRDSEEN